MSGWVKHFTDETKEYGIDRYIAQGKASWTKGRLSDIKQVEIITLNNNSILSVPNTEWFQFDRFEITMDSYKPEPVRTHRAVQALLKSFHGEMLLGYNKNARCHEWHIIDYKTAKLGSYQFVKHMRPHCVGKWITVVSPKNNVPYIKFGSKGIL